MRCPFNTWHSYNDENVVGYYIAAQYFGIFFLCDHLAMLQGVYYYCYQVFKNKAEAIAAKNLRRGRGNGSVGIFSWLVVAALAGYSPI